MLFIHERLGGTGAFMVQHGWLGEGYTTTHVLAQSALAQAGVETLLYLCAFTYTSHTFRKCSTFCFWVFDLLQQ